MNTLHIACGTDVGRVRQANEDAFINADHPDATVTAARGRLVVVADGMGGALGGGTASNLAAHTLAQTWFSETEQPAAIALANAVHAANAEIYRQAAGNEHLRGMGSTLTAAAVLGNQVWFAQVGDSRAYLVRDGRAQQLTRDHSKVGMLLHDGLITPEQAANHPERNVILRSLGPHPTVEVDVEGPLELRPGDALVLCSDGLHGHLRTEELGPLVVGSPDQVVEALIELANQRGGEDNITVAVAVLGALPAGRRVPITRPGIDVGDTRHGLPALGPAGWTGRQKRMLVGLIILALALLAVVVVRQAQPPLQPLAPAVEAIHHRLQPAAVPSAVPPTRHHDPDVEDLPEAFPNEVNPRDKGKKPKEKAEPQKRVAPISSVSPKVAPPTVPKESNLNRLLDEDEAAPPSEGAPVKPLPPKVEKHK